MFWHATREVARKEFLQHIRSTRLIIVGLLFAASLIVTTIVFPVSLGFDEAFSEGDGANRADGPYVPGGENVAMAFFLTIPILGGVFFMQVLAIIMTSDAVCSEWNNRSIFLLLSKPVPRGAFLLGKFLGSVVPLVVMVSLLMIIDYLVLQAIFPGDTIARDWGRFFGGLGMIVLGLTVFSTMGLFFSTLTRSTLASLFMTFGVAFLALPLVGLIGEINLWTDQENAAFGELDPDAAEYDWSRYFNPGSIFTKANEVIAGEDFAFGFSFLVPTQAPAHTWLSVVAGLGFAVLFYAGAWVMVQTRNFE
ncbi:MAG: ABC transporter permease [Thermoplasmatota archaeon]